MSERPATGNPFAVPSADAPQAQAPPPGPSSSTPGPSAPAQNGSGEEAKLTGYIQRFPEPPPATGYPVQGYPVYNSGGAFATSYPHWGSATTYPNYPPPQQPPSPSQPLYTFEQSAPGAQNYGQQQGALACGCGLQWVLFICGWLLPLIWYIGVVMRYIGRFDLRERAGWLANCIMSAVFTVVWMVIVIRDVGKHSGSGSESDDSYCDPVAGCL